MTDQDPVLGILIPADTRDPIVHVGIDMVDGGYVAVWEHLEGEPDDLDYPGRADLTAYIREDGMRNDLPRNNRATALLAPVLPPGGWVGGPCLITGQGGDSGIVVLPDDINAARIKADTVNAPDAPEPAPLNTWGASRWRCEDCGETGIDVGVPEACPECGSASTVVVPDA